VAVNTQSVQQNGMTCWKWLLPLVVAAIAAMALYRSPFNASDLGIVPDSVEYAVAGNRIATDGRYDIVINGQHFPPRYPPWFSLFVLAPTYLILGTEIGNAIYPVTLLAVIGVLAAFMIGRRISGNPGGLLAAMILLILPGYHQLGREIMTDVPCVALILLQCLVYLRLRSAQCTLPLLWFSLAGILAAICGAFRPACYSTLIPFFILAVSSREGREKLARAIFLVFPGIVMIATTLRYNAVAIGSPFRSGYNFWCPVPYDYFNLTFSLRYVTANLEIALYCGLAPLLLVLMLIAVADRRRAQNATDAAFEPSLRDVVQFTVLGTAPIVVAHLFYFFPDGRFFLPATSLLAVAAGGLIGMRFTHARESSLLLAGLLVLAVVVAVRYTYPDVLPCRRMAAEDIRQNTPKDASVVSRIDPVYLSFFIGHDSKRRVIPLSRDVEYASKLIAPKKINDPQPPPRNCVDHRCSGLLKGGAREVIPRVFNENSDTAINDLVQATSVYIDFSVMTKREVKSVFRPQRTFDSVRRVNCLYELVPRTPQPSAPAGGQSEAGTSPQHIPGTQTSGARWQ